MAKPKQGDFIAQLSKPKRSENKPNKFTWDKPVSGAKPQTQIPTQFNRQKSPKTPTPTSDIPIKPNGEIDLARVRQTVQAKSKRFNK